MYEINFAFPPASTSSSVGFLVIVKSAGAEEVAESSGRPSAKPVGAGPQAQRRSARIRDARKIRAFFVFIFIPPNF